MKKNHARLWKKLTLSALCLAFVACSNGTSDSPAAPAPNTLATESSAESNAGIAASGAMRSESSVTSHEFAAGETSSGGDSMTLEQILAAFPVLADRASMLSSIDRVVETDAGTWDLYAGGTLVMTLANNGSGGLHVVSATGGFTADSVMLVSGNGDQDQGKSTSGIKFVMSSCRAEEPKQDQEQDKEEPKQDQDQTPDKEEPKQDQDQTPDKEEPKQDQDQTPDKEEPKQDQDQTPDKEEPKQDQDQTPDKEEPKQDQDQTPDKEEPKQDQEQDKEEPTEEEDCAAIEGTLWLEEVDQKQEQDQEPTKEEPKQDQEQEKEEPNKEEPKQDQDQDKEEPTKEEPKQDQEQDKEEPKQDQEQEPDKEEPKQDQDQNGQG